MNHSHSDDLPSELDELGRRISDERPVASGRTLDNVMTRAQGARTRRSSLLWRSSAPRTPRKTIAIVVAALFATGGMATAASANGLLGNLLGGNGLLSSLLGTGGGATGNCTGNGLVAIGAGIGSDCSGSSSTHSSSGGNNCTATGAVAIGLSVLSNCSGDGSVRAAPTAAQPAAWPSASAS